MSDARVAMWCSQPMSSPVSSKTAVPPAATSAVEDPADHRVRGDPARAVRPPQMVPTTRSDSPMGHRRRARSRRRRTSSIQACPASIVARVPPRCWITSVVTGRPDAATTSASCSRSKPSQPSDTSIDGADVRVGAELLQHSLGVGARVAAAEADDVHVLHAGRDRLRHGAGALHEVDDRDDVCGCRPGRRLTLVAEDRCLAPRALGRHRSTAAVREGARCSRSPGCACAPTRRRRWPWWLNRSDTAPHDCSPRPRSVARRPCGRVGRAP